MTIMKRRRMMARRMTRRMMIRSLQTRERKTRMVMMKKRAVTRPLIMLTTTMTI